MGSFFSFLVLVLATLLPGGLFFLAIYTYERKRLLKEQGHLDKIIEDFEKRGEE
jgi:hypothetical protein